MVRPLPGVADAVPQAAHSIAVAQISALVISSAVLRRISLGDRVVAEREAAGFLHGVTG